MLRSASFLLSGLFLTTAPLAAAPGDNKAAPDIQGVPNAPLPTKDFKAWMTEPSAPSKEATKSEVTISVSELLLENVKKEAQKETFLSVEYSVTVPEEEEESVRSDKFCNAVRDFAEGEDTKENKRILGGTKLGQLFLLLFICQKNKIISNLDYKLYLNRAREITFDASQANFLRMLSMHGAALDNKTFPKQEAWFNENIVNYDSVVDSVKANIADKEEQKEDCSYALRDILRNTLDSCKLEYFSGSTSYAIKDDPLLANEIDIWVRGSYLRQEAAENALKNLVDTASSCLKPRSVGQQFIHDHCKKNGEEGVRFSSLIQIYERKTVAYQYLEALYKRLAFGTQPADMSAEQRDIFCFFLQKVLHHVKERATLSNSDATVFTGWFDAPPVWLGELYTNCTCENAKEVPAEKKQGSFEIFDACHLHMNNHQEWVRKFSPDVSDTPERTTFWDFLDRLERDPRAANIWWQAIQTSNKTPAEKLHTFFLVSAVYTHTHTHTRVFLGPDSDIQDQWTCIINHLSPENRTELRKIWKEAKSMRSKNPLDIPTSQERPDIGSNAIHAIFKKQLISCNATKEGSTQESV